MTTRIATVALAACTVLGIAASAPQAQAKPDSARHLTGVLADGSTYVIDVPATWNGELVVYGHGYGPKTAQDAPDPTTGDALLSRGYALAGSSYRNAGWAVNVGPADQLATITAFRRIVGTPRRTIAWGTSMGGEITALLAERGGQLINGAVPMCPAVSGELAWWNANFDAMYAIATLLAPASHPPLVGITNPAAELAAWQKIIDAAQQTPAGRARLALAAVLGSVPGWTNPADPEPGRHDYAGQESQQYQGLAEDVAVFATTVRQDVENHAGGPFSWNTGVNYQALLARTGHHQQEVQSLYRTAGISLRGDLTTLNTGTRVAVTDPAALAYLQALAPTGRLAMPVLTLATTDDPVIRTNQEANYKRTVDAAGDSWLLRQTYIHQAGHCTFTSSEMVAAVLTLNRRLSDGHWPDTSATALNRLASSLGLGSATFVDFHPQPLLRP